MSLKHACDKVIGVSVAQFTHETYLKAAQDELTLSMVMFTCNLT